jgi:hypothetical protein
MSASYGNPFRESRRELHAGLAGSHFIFTRIVDISCSTDNILNGLDIQPMRSFG